MKHIALVIAANLASIVCLSFAGYLAMNEKDGWGWFLFVAVLAAGSIKFKD